MRVGGKWEEEEENGGSQINNLTLQLKELEKRGVN